MPHPLDFEELLEGIDQEQLMREINEEELERQANMFELLQNKEATVNEEGQLVRNSANDTPTRSPSTSKGNHSNASTLADRADASKADKFSEPEPQVLLAAAPDPTVTQEDQDVEEFDCSAEVRCRGLAELTADYPLRC